MSDFNDMRAALGEKAVQEAIEGAELVPLEEANAGLGRNYNAILERLSSLHPFEYERSRENEAEKLSIRVSVLDSEIMKLRLLKEKADKNASDACGFEEVMPWEESVDGALLFAELVSVFKTYLSLQAYQAETLALWAIFSHCIDAGNIAPKLLIYSPEKRCGKTTLLDVLMNLVWKALPASNISPAATFRAIESIGGTIMIDEADTFIKDNPELQGIINSGHRKSLAYTLRCEGNDFTPKKFSTWAPTVIAMIGKPKDTILDRSILIEMKRKRPDEDVKRFIHHKQEAGLHILARKICRWADDHFDALSAADPLIPGGLHDRAADNWRPLLAIADQMGEEIAKKARIAAKSLSTQEEDEDHASASNILLSDIRDYFETNSQDGIQEATGEHKVTTQDLLIYLHGLEERPWPEWNRGKPITPRQIARLLRPFGIASKKIRIGYKTNQGYTHAQFIDAFARYLSGTPEHPSKNNDLEENLNGTACPIVPEYLGAKALIYNTCSGVPDSEVI